MKYVVITSQVINGGLHGLNLSNHLTFKYTNLILRLISQIFLQRYLITFALSSHNVNPSQYSVLSNMTVSQQLLEHVINKCLYIKICRRRRCTNIRQNNSHRRFLPRLHNFIVIHFFARLIKVIVDAICVSIYHILGTTDSSILIWAPTKFPSLDLMTLSSKIIWIKDE